MSSACPSISLIVGTAGHIDHGKTALVRALTGTDTDRLPEEKRRGITIELGFAEMALEEVKFGIVDVPGHERFVRQMLAGATGMDLAMLIVAADESVKPQTREHLDVLRFLNLRGGVIVLTKCDLVDADWLELVEEDVRELVRGTVLENRALVRTSAHTGAGIDQLKNELLAEARRVAAERPSHEEPFRIPIDRVFSVAGHGTVITGSIVSGTVQVGDAVVIQPMGIEARVRQIQNHERTVLSAHRGERAALNLAGIHLDQLTRGHELAAPGFLQPARRLLVSLELVPDGKVPLKHRSRVRFHVGTADIAATVDTLGVGEIPPGDPAIVQLTLAEPVATTWGQPYVIRRESPAETLGGGRILVPDAPKLRALTDTERQLAGELLGRDEAQRAVAAVYFAAHRIWHPRDLRRLAGVSQPEAICKALEDAKILVPFSLGPSKFVLVHRDVIASWEERIQAYLTSFHDKNPLATLLERATLGNAFAYLGDPGIIPLLLDKMGREGKVRITERGVGLKDRQPKLSNNQRATLRTVVELIRNANLQPPWAEELRKSYPAHAKEMEMLLEIGVSDSELVRIAKGFYVHSQVEEDMRRKLKEVFQLRPDLTVSDIREALGTTRKFAVPLCEYLDQVGFTVRKGDQRSLAREVRQ
jgi:selenocysteine-specific elongation factor